MANLEDSRDQEDPNLRQVEGKVSWGRDPFAEPEPSETTAQRRSWLRSLCEIPLLCAAVGRDQEGRKGGRDLLVVSFTENPTEQGAGPAVSGRRGRVGGRSSQIHLVIQFSNF
jgi:hypothetical protein